MSMGVTTAGPGMSGSGSAPTVTGGVHPGTVGQGSLGPGTGSGISISSGLGSSNVSVSAGTGTMPPPGLDFVKVCVFRRLLSFFGA